MDRPVGLQEDGTYAEYFTVTGTDADMRGRWKMSSVFRCIQNISSDHCDACGCGRDTLMAKRGLCYIIIRSHVKFDRIPLTGEKIRVVTWPDIRLRLIFDRFYRFYDGNGDEIGCARTRWVLMDYRTRQAVKPYAEDMHFTVSESLGVTFEMPHTGWTEKEIGHSDAVAENHITRKTVYGDYDYNLHVNNTRYIDWVTDALAESGTDPAVREIDMNYHNEIPADCLGNTFEMTAKTADKGMFSVVCASENGTRIFLCEGITVK